MIALRALADLALLGVIMTGWWVLLCRTKQLRQEKADNARLRQLVREMSGNERARQSDPG